MSPAEDQLDSLVQRLVKGDETALAQLFSLYRERLWRIVNFRLDRRLQGRVDTDDVLQESYLNAVQRMDRFLYDHPRSFFIWMRMIVTQTLIDVHRRHIGAQKRDASRDISIQGRWAPATTSHSLSFHLLGHLTSPSQAALRAELSEQIDLALSGMSDIDREVLALRHFEELSNLEIAQLLGLSEQAASLRYIRAISRLRDVLEKIPGFFSE
ncbi:MAG: sigma-70 family RNA polymerase sigma factor [Planctomycetaceae bacterium]